MRGMRCEYCGEPLRRSRGSVYRHRGKRHVLFERVAALICGACGHRVFEASAVETMEHALAGLGQPKVRRRRIEPLILST